MACPHRLTLQIIAFFMLILLLSGCGNDASRILKEKISQADLSLNQLKSALDEDQIRNAVLLREYAATLSDQKPDMRNIIDALKSEASSNGRQYQALVNRLDKVKTLDKQFGNPDELIPEAQSIIKGSDPTVFNDALVDPINVLADMSDGKLPRIGVISKEEEKDYNGAKDYGPGSQLVGNPAYGSWHQSGGTSFWEWYGMYAMFSNLFGGHRIYYNDWNRYRPYSYYNDYGIDNYGSSRYRNRWESSYQKSAAPGTTKPTNTKSYAGTRKSSSYRSGGGVTARTPSPRKTSQYSGSLRSSSYSSRSSRSGK